jgi:spore coat protein U-like protein
MNKLILSTTIAALLASASAGAATKTASMPVSATVAYDCTVAVTPLSFGTYTGALKDSTATVTAACNGPITYNIGLGLGTGVGATTAVRKLTRTSGGQTLNYLLSSIAALDAPALWGTTIGTDTVSATAIGGLTNTTAHTVYGRLLESTGSLIDGSYNDTVVVTMTY